MAKKAEKAAHRRPVLVTTAHRGVFFGYLADEVEAGEGYSTVTLESARCAIRWSTTKGFLELADVGPNSSSKIGARAPRIVLRKVTSLADCTPAAAAAWEKA